MEAHNASTLIDHHTKLTFIKTNLIKMLVNRRWINPERQDDVIAELVEADDNLQTHRIRIDASLSELRTYPYNRYNIDATPDTHEVDDIVLVRIISAKVTKLKLTPVNEFVLGTDSISRHHRILIVDGYSDQMFEQVLRRPHVEILTQQSLMRNLVDVAGSPSYEILSRDEAEQMLSEYTSRPEQLKRMLVSDPASLYLGVIPGQIVRIIRSSEIAGTAIDYRMIVTAPRKSK